jgi:hypothetical protein
MSAKPSFVFFAFTLVGAAAVACGGATASDLFSGSPAASSADAGDRPATEAPVPTTDATDPPDPTPPPAPTATATSTVTPPPPPPPGQRLCDPTNPLDCRGINQYCLVLGCGPNAPSKCEPRPSQLDNSRAPVCGCDGITYWNESVRMAAMPFALQRDNGRERVGECTTTALACDRQGNIDCPGNTKCARKTNNACTGPVPKGTCWDLPLNCPNPAATSLVRSCRNGALGECASECNIIKSERGFTTAGPACQP